MTITIFGRKLKFKRLIKRLRINHKVKVRMKIKAQSYNVYENNVLNSH